MARTQKPATRKKAPTKDDNKEVEVTKVKKGFVKTATPKKRKAKPHDEEEEEEEGSNSSSSSSSSSSSASSSSSDEDEKLAADNRKPAPVRKDKETAVPVASGVAAQKKAAIAAILNNPSSVASVAESSSGRTTQEDAMEKKLKVWEEKLTNNCFMDDKPVSELTTAMENCVKAYLKDSLWSKMKFYRSDKDADCFVGWVLFKVGFKDPYTPEGRIQRLKHWSVVRTLIRDETKREVQQVVTKFYYVAQGKILFLCYFKNINSLTLLFVVILYQNI
jgi:hypothetical protein